MGSKNRALEAPGGDSYGYRQNLTMGPWMKRLAVIAVGTACSSPPPPVAKHPAHEQHEQHGHHHGFANAEEWSKVFDDPARDASQRPDEVIRAMELTPNMTVADIGAGTGYFSVRLARAVPQGAVIATDLEPDMVRFLSERARREQLANLQARLGPPRTSGLVAQSVDRVLIVDVWHHLDARVAYARDLGTALKPGGKVFIVDYRLSAKQGPPPNMRLTPEAMMAELESAGFTTRVVLLELEDQYMIEARR